jgi:hypothetical protein
MNDVDAFRTTLQTLYKILTNIITQPLEPKVRSLKLTNEGVRIKIGQWKHARQFLSQVKNPI